MSHKAILIYFFYPWGKKEQGDPVSQGEHWQRRFQ